MVGKTSLVLRIIENKFFDEYKSTICVGYHVKRISTDQSIEFWDISGNSRFISFSDTYTRGTHILLVLVDLTRVEKTLEVVPGILERINHNSGKPQIYIIGSKCDKVKNLNNEKIKKFCEERKLKYCPCSSKSDVGVDTIMNEIYSDIEKMQSYSKMVIDDDEPSVVEEDNNSIFSTIFKKFLSCSGLDQI